MVFLVVTHGRSSVDLYSIRLSSYLPVQTIHTNIYQEFSKRFSKSLLSFSTFKVFLLAWRFAKRLNKLPGIPHLPNHHLGRCGYFLKKPFIITVHDVMRYLDMKGVSSTPLIRKPSLQDTLWLHLDYKGVRKAARIIAPSYFTKMSIVKYLGVPEEKISVVYHGVDEVFKPCNSRRPCLEPYILYVGSEQPRKNVQTLLKAFSLLKRSFGFKDLKLVKVGRAGGREWRFRDETMKIVKALKLEKDVIFIDWVSREELAAFYTNAELFAFPSIYEGFGWPPLEAMACGCPVVSSNATSIPEVLGDAAIYVDPYNVEGWSQAIANVLTDDKLRRRLSAKGLDRAKCFSWRRTAELTLKIYKDVEEEFRASLVNY